MNSLAWGESVPPPGWVDEDIRVPATVERDLVLEMRLGRYRARFEETPLREIQGKIGAGTLEHAGDAAGAMVWLCYSLPGQLVWFVSTEMGGAEDWLMQVFAEAINEADARKKSCPPIPTTFRPLSLTFGWLGSSRRDVQKALGTPSGVIDDWEFFLFAGKKRGTYQAPGDADSQVVDFDVTAYVEVRIKKDKVVALRASHLTSN